MFDFIDNHQDFCLRVVFKPTFRAAVLAEKLTLLRAPILSLSALSHNRFDYSFDSEVVQCYFLCQCMELTKYYV